MKKPHRFEIRSEHIYDSVQELCPETVGVESDPPKFRPMRMFLQMERWLRRPQVSLMDTIISMSLALMVLACAGWSTYRGDSSMRGWWTADVPERLDLVWSFSAGAAVEQTPVSDGTNLFFYTDKGDVFCVSAEGKEIWRKRLFSKQAGTNVFFSTPLVVGGEMVLGGTRDGRVVALHAENGEAVWEYDLYGGTNGGDAAARTGLMGSPVFALAQGQARVLLVSKPDGKLHCVDAQTGSKVWVGAETDRTDGSLAVLGARVAMGNCSGSLYVFSVEDGTLQHTISLPGPGHIAGGVAMSQTDVFAGVHEGAVVRANLDTGAVTWARTNLEEAVDGIVAVGSNCVVASTETGQVLCMNREDGTLVWTVTVKPDAGSPVIAGESVLVSGGGALYSMALKDGRRKQVLEISDEITDPMCFQNLVVVGCDDGRVMAYGAKKGKGKG